jgi:fatty acid desaturase
MEAVLLISGLAAVAIGTWRGYANARAVLAPLVHPGEPTRTAVEATQPLTERARVRRAARNVAAAVAWLALAMYGLFLISSFEAAR